ncbi:1-acyl-sn-glycerol-3-phosphate acyltransferase [Fontimonas thermophila]|uniref:1-acyl-sn-glycerol-3-phosphate acyltransferase n=1 Tax=Fontimonas thermophila TaxID=1076937 RepID=A0A1I2JYV3_9GAMM|nr:lysophospholipid acyltransferase family protein [Fontimonas thermophila]SFF58107.1 1-acyl-sn-glycerol-3-phosphate acyltransferase [Fontimonas thermophila]
MSTVDIFKQLASVNPGEALYRRLVTPEIEALFARIPKPVGSFGYDPWGYNENAAKLAVGIFRWLYEHYFRVTAHGLEHVPPQGRVLIVPNHSGQLPLDGVLIGYALATNPHGPRAARAMIERFFPTVPWLGNWLNAVGAVIGDPLNCSKMLEQEEAIIVFPEGVRGSGKLYKQRYQLQRFGNGFMHLALQHRAPIVPVGVVGCEETMPSFANIAPLARLLGLPYVPLGPLLPLPARVYLYFGEPMVFEGSAKSEEEVNARVEQVKERIRELIARGLKERQQIF